VLLIGQVDSTTTAAWQSALASEGVPFDLVIAGGGGSSLVLPTLSAGDVGHYNGVVIADSPTGYAAGVLDPVFDYESAFGVRQLDGYMYPSPALGVTAFDGGSRDGVVGHVTTAGLALLPGLKGPFPFDAGSYGYSATVTGGGAYTSILDDANGHTMAGVYQHPSTDRQAGVSELALNFNYNASQLHWLLLAPGLIDWVTQGTHLGLSRNYFGQDIDDVFIADNAWSSQYQCTPGATEPLDFTCPAGVAGDPTKTPADTLMSAADVTHVVAWQRQTGIRLNLAFNAVGACTGPVSSSAVCTGGAAPYTLPGFTVDAAAPDASGLTDALLATKAEFNWIMHTWSHAFLGCNVWGPQVLTGVGAGGGGTLPAGSHSYLVTAATAYGESEPSTAQAVTVAAGGSATLTWPEATNGTGDTGNAGPTLAQLRARYSSGTGFWGYNVYRQSPGSTTYGLVGQVAEGANPTAATTYSFTDTGTAAGGAPETDSTFPTATNPGIGCTSNGWLSASAIQQEIGLDQAFAVANGFTSLPAGQYTQNAVVTGEHSGVENPNMPTALNAVGVTTFAQDASRQPTQYSLGNAIGAPRYPSNIYYNASNWTDQLNEYNTLYVQSGTAFPGGTGRCVGTSSTTCRTTPATKADLLASESRIMLSHVQANDPRLGYAHQPNLIGPAGEGYTLLDLIDNMLGQYNAWHTAPLVQVTDVSSAHILAQQTGWKAAQTGGQVKANVRNGVVTVTNGGTAVDVPVTVPNGTAVNGGAFGESYAGTRSAWATLGTAATLTLNQNVAPTILSAGSATSIVGASFTETVVTTGAPTATITETGALPGGITFTDNGNGTATIAGTSASGTGGSYPVTITASNPSGTVTQAFTLTNAEAPSITSPSTASFNIGVAGTYKVTTTGYPAATITETGTLPGGLTFAAATDGTATIAGTPAAGTAGSYPVTITATNVSGSTATLALTVTVNAAAAPVITSGATASFTLNQAGAVAIVATGSPTPTITETGTLPTGLAFTANSNGTALIQGTPTVTGTSPVSITAANGISPNATQTFTIIVGQAPTFTSPATATFTAGTASSFTVTTSGYPAPAIGATGLPTGLILTDNKNGTATITGTAAAADAGPHSVTLNAVNGTGTGTQTLTVTIPVTVTAPAAPAIGSATAAGPTSATVGWTAPAAGGSAITGYSVRVLNTANVQVGALRPAAAGATSLVVTGLTTGQTYHFTVTATNAVGTSAASPSSSRVALIVPGTPGIGVASAGAAGGAITATANWTAPAANAGPAITAYQVVAERLSATGAVLATTTSANQSATARTLSMTLPVAGNYRFSVRAINIVGNSALSARSNMVAGQ